MNTIKEAIFTTVDTEADDEAPFMIEINPKLEHIYSKYVERPVNRDSPTNFLKKVPLLIESSKDSFFMHETEIPNKKLTKLKPADTTPKV